MLKVKPEYLSKHGKRQFVVLTIEDFDRMREALDDAQDLRDLRRATRSNAGKPYYTPGEVERRLANRSTQTERISRRSASVPARRNTRRS